MHKIGDLTRKLDTERGEAGNGIFLSAGYIFSSGTLLFGILERKRNCLVTFTFEACTCCFSWLGFVFVLCVVLCFFLVLLVFPSCASFLLGRKREFSLR
jgi:hypothetical protein